MARLDWLIARPIAHRGLHDAAQGVIENTASAVRAAIDAGYGIEVDLRITADGEAMVHHDETLGRVIAGKSRLDKMLARDLKDLPIGGTTDRMMTLSELCTLVAGRAPLLIELKSRYDDDARLVRRAAEVLAGYRHGNVAAMSFDPVQMAGLRAAMPGLLRGIIVDEQYAPSIAALTAKSVLRAWPQFLAYSIDDLPARRPALARVLLRMPVLTWTVRTEEQRHTAARSADQIIFERLRP